MEIDMSSLGHRKVMEVGNTVSGRYNLRFDVFFKCCLYFDFMSCIFSFTYYKSLCLCLYVVM